MEKITLKVTGMSCAHCEKAVVNGLTDIGAQIVTASAQNNTVEVTYDPATLSPESIKNEINDMGYVCESNA